MKRFAIKFTIKMLKRWMSRNTLDEIYLGAKIREEERNEKADNIARSGRTA